MKLPDNVTRLPAARTDARAAPAHSLTTAADATRRSTLSVAERQQLAAKVVLHAVAQPIAAITQPLSPIRPEAVNAPLPASAVFTPRPGGGRRS